MALGSGTMSIEDPATEGQTFGTLSFPTVQDETVVEDPASEPDSIYQELLDEQHPDDPELK